MTVLNYLFWVQKLIAKSEPNKQSANYQQWFGDTGTIRNTITDYTCGNCPGALRIAEELAEHYGQ